MKQTQTPQKEDVLVSFYLDKKIYDEVTEYYNKLPLSKENPAKKEINKRGLYVNIFKLGFKEVKHND